MIMVYFAVAIVILVNLRMFLLAVFGLKAIKETRLKDALMECRNGRLSDAYNELGLSVLVSGVEKQEDLVSLMSLELIRYEVVVLLDFASDNLVDDILTNFKMIKVDKLPSRELACMAVRGVYHSGDTRYSRLVLVDINKGSCSQRFNCGANLARYEYVIALEAGCVLASGSVCSAIRTILEQPPVDVVCAVGGYRMGTVPKGALRVVDLAVRLVVMGAGFHRFSHWGESVSIVFDREYLVQAGGYGVDANYDYELYQRMKRMNERTKDEAQSILMPKVFVYDKNCCGVQPHKRILSVGFIFCILLALMLFCLISEFLNVILLSVALSYMVSVSVALMSLNAARGVFDYKYVFLLPFMSLFYPFFLIFKIIKRVRF